ncbi:MAG: hypothetical protein AB9856_14400 [Cellulosilyticaceae bacterium]
MDIEFIDNKIGYWENVKKLLLEELPNDASLDTVIYKKYLELENVAEVAKWLNKSGYSLISKSTGASIKYISNNVTERLEDKKADVDEELKQCVQKIFKNHKKYASKRWT